MSCEKEPINSHEESYYEINNISDIFDNEKLKSEIYNSLGVNGFFGEILDKYKEDSLPIEIQSDIERISHYCFAKLLYDRKVIDHIENFATSKKTLKSCFNGNLEDVRLLWRSLIPSMFSSIKEQFLGANSWQDYLDRFGEENFESLLDDVKNFAKSEQISLIKPSHLSSKQLISEIRNALDHTRYVFGPNGLYIKNPKNEYHKHEFEAEIPYNFLLLLILDVYYIKPKNSLGIYLQCDKEIYSNPNNLKFDDFKDKFHIYQYLAKGKDVDNAITKKREIKLSKYLIGDVGEIVQQQNGIGGCGGESEDDVLEEGGLLTNYFSKEKFEIKRLQYISTLLEGSLIVPMSRLVYYLLIDKNSYKGLKSDELMDDIYRSLSPMFFDPLGCYCASEQEMSDLVKNYHLNNSVGTGENPFDEKYSGEKYRILNRLVGELEKVKQKDNGQSMLKTFGGCWRYADKYLIKCGFRYDGKTYKKGEIEITEKELSSLCGHLSDIYFISSGIIGSFPNRLKVQMIKMVYLNELIPLQKGNKGKKSEEERIRNALAHDNFIVLAGVDQVLLRDGYSRSNDKWNWERLYKLSELYENTFKAMDENMKSVMLNSDWRIKKVNPKEEV